MQINILKQGNFKAVERTHLMGIPIFFSVFFVSSFLAIYFGSDFVKMLVDGMPIWLSNGLTIASKMLPAVGMAMLLKMMDFKKYLVLFLRWICFGRIFEFESDSSKFDCRSDCCGYLSA